MSEELQSVRTVEMVAAEIRALTASMLGNIVEIGRRMCEAKEMLPYGSFGTWIKENTGYSSSTANNFMRLFQEYGAAQGSLFGAQIESQTIGKLSYSKALALLSLPAEEREEFAEANDVENMSTRELQQAIRERDEARKAAETAQETISESEKSIKALKDRLEEAMAKIDALEIAEEKALEKYENADREADALKEELEALRSRPVDVAVQADEEAVERARQEAIETANAVHQAREKEAEEAHKKAVEALQAKLDEKDADMEKAMQQRDAAKEEADKAAKARQEAERLAAELREKLDAAAKKEQVNGNRDLVEFNLYFKAAQDELEKMETVLGRLAESGQDELREKLKKAVAAIGARAAEIAEV